MNFLYKFKNRFSVVSTEGPKYKVENQWFILIVTGVPGEKEGDIHGN